MLALIGDFGYIGRADLVVRSTKPALTKADQGRIDMAIPTQARLRELFNYVPQSGALIWRQRPLSEFKSPAAHQSFVARCQGREAGFIDAGGYRIVRMDGASQKGHRLVWLFVIGDWPSYPDFEIDHLNGIKSDNRIQNLRKCTKSMNQRNGSMRVNNKSGVIGVNWVKSKQAWIARIWDGPKHRYLGQFRDIANAAAARAEAERDIGYHVGHGKSIYPEKRAKMGRKLRAAR